MAGERAFSIAIVCPYDVSAPGGAQTQALGLAAELSSRREISSVTLIAPGAASGDFRFVSVGRGTPVPVNGSRAPVALTPAAWGRTAEALREASFDIVHVHEPMAPLVGLAALSSAKAPVLATFHRDGVDPLYRLEGRLLKTLTARIAKSVAVSEAARATAAEALSLRVETVIPNGVALPAEPPAPKAAQPTVAFIGRHEERKGLSVLLEAFQALPPEARLEVAGEGPETARLKARYAFDGRITWRGLISDAEKPALLSNAHLLSAPSLRGESFGVILLEAMAVGTAVVASDLPGYRLAAGGAAELVPPGDVAALASSLNQLLSDAEGLARLAERGRGRAAQLSLASAADSYLQLYEALAAS